MKKKIAGLLLIVLCLGMIPSAKAGFIDIGDGTAQLAASVLEGMGIVSGYPDGGFHPDDELTRAQLCKLVLLLAGKEKEVSLYERQTRFNDVRSDHWAVGYVNLACSLGYISGYGNGSFGPDDPVTYAQAVTILLRQLGYTESQIGAYWPEDYIAYAAGLDLNDGLSVTANSILTRGQAAQLLYNLLLQENASDRTYCMTLSDETLSSAILLDPCAVSDDGKTGQAYVFSEGKFSYYDQERPLSEGLTGLRGTFLLSESGRIKGFVPEKQQSLSVTASKLTSASITDENGNKHTVSDAAGVIINGDYQNWLLGFANVHTGSRVQLFFDDNGSVDLIYVSAASRDGDVAVATAKSTGTTDPFAALLGLEKDSYRLVKNGVEASVSDLAQYDVGSYDPTTNTVQVSDFKLTAYWEDAYPNASTPSSVTLMGYDFSVLPSARETFAKFSLGDQITVLLTADFQVAAVYSATTLRADAPIGILQTDNTGVCKVTLLNGLCLTGTLAENTTSVDSLNGQLVTISGTGGGFYIRKLSYTKAKSAWSVDDRKIGDVMLSAGIRIFDQAGESTVYEVTEDDILIDTVSKDKILHANYNSAGKIDLLVLKDLTGNSYTYGLLDVGTQTTGRDGLNVANYTVSVINGSGKSQSLLAGRALEDNSFAGIAATGDGKLAAVAELTRISNVKRDAFIGIDLIAVNDVSIPVAEDVQVYNKTSETWSTLELAKAYTDTFSVYYDKTPETGGKVRVIVFEQ